MPASAMFNHLYEHDVDGGPICGPHIFYVRRIQWQPEFERMQLRLTSEKKAGERYYRLVPNVV